MRRVLALVVTAVTLFTCSTGLAETAIVNTESTSLNVRDAYDSSIIIGSVGKGKSIEIDYFDKFWGYLTFNGQKAKVYLTYLCDPSGKPFGKSNSSSSSGKPNGGSKKTYEPEPASIEDASIICTVSYSVRTHITVRAKKDMGSKDLGHLYPGDEVYVIAMGNNWSRIVYDDHVGFVLSRYLEDSDVNLPSIGDLYRVKVKKGTTLNVRPEESTKKKAIAKLRNGALVKVVAKSTSWSYVYYTMDDLGYVMNKYIVQVDE